VLRLCERGSSGGIRLVVGLELKVDGGHLVRGEIDSVATEPLERIELVINCRVAVLDEDQLVEVMLVHELMEYLKHSLEVVP